MTVKGKFTSFHVSVAAMMFTAYFAATENYFWMGVSIGVVFAERLIVQFLMWYAKLLVKKMASEMGEQMGFQLQEIQKALSQGVQLPPFDQEQDSEETR